MITTNSSRKRLGIIKIARTVIEQQWPELGMIFQHVIPIKISEPASSVGVLEYVCYSHFFDWVEEEAQIPVYNVEVHKLNDGYFFTIERN